jgi:hypothetical protein
MTSALSVGCGFDRKGMWTMSEDAGRPDPLRVALTAIGDFDREVVAYSEAGLEPSSDTKFQRAQLRVLFALAAEVRQSRQELAKHTEYLIAHYKLQLDQYGLNQDGHALHEAFVRAQLAAMGVQDGTATD